MSLNNLLIKFKTKITTIKRYSVNELPDRTKIFLSALWVWIYISFYINKVIGYIFIFVLTYTPDSCIIFHPKLIKKQKNIPEILDAKLGEETITNKLKMLVKSQWDSDIPESGGVNVKNLVSKYPALSTSVIWIAYLLEVDKKIQEMSDEEIGKSIKCMLINISDKSIYRDSSVEIKEELLFGEIPF